MGYSLSVYSVQQRADRQLSQRVWTLLNTLLCSMDCYKAADAERVADVVSKLHASVLQAASSPKRGSPQSWVLVSYITLVQGLERDTTCAKDVPNEVGELGTYGANDSDIDI